jgi:hypothetical protein
MLGCFWLIGVGQRKGSEGSEQSPVDREEVDRFNITEAPKKGKGQRRFGWLVRALIWPPG